MLIFNRTLSNHYNCLNKILNIVRLFSKERASKAVKPGTSIIIDDVPHRVIKMIQGKRGKGFLTHQNISQSLSLHIYISIYAASYLYIHSSIPLYQCIHPAI